MEIVTLSGAAQFLSSENSFFTVYTKQNHKSPFLTSKISDMAQHCLHCGGIMLTLFV
jgi:hypothetical protein